MFVFGIWDGVFLTELTEVSNFALTTQTFLSKIK